MAKKYLDYNGLLHFWNQIKNIFIRSTDLTEVAFTGNSSDLNNDAGFITQDEVLTNKPIPNTWDITHGMPQLITSISEDDTAVQGMSYLGTVYLNDLPAGMMLAELIINIMANDDSLGKNITFTLTSFDTAPYHWEYTSAWSALGEWRGFGEHDWDIYEETN